MGAFVISKDVPNLRDISVMAGSQKSHAMVLVTENGKNNPLRLKTARTGICEESHTLNFPLRGGAGPAESAGDESSGFLTKSAVVRKNLTV